MARNDRRDERGSPRRNDRRDRNERDMTGRRRGQGRGTDRVKRDDRSVIAAPDGDLPRWIRDEITRTAPKDRREPAIMHLSRAVADFAGERYGAAYEGLRRAKDLAPQAATIRELLGLSAYHTRRWEEALRELRTFRRISGESTQVPVEIDCLRALGRPEDVEKTWRKLQELDHTPETDDEARVVYASALLDAGRVADAWKAIQPGRLVANPRMSALRRWFVAVRVARAAGDNDAATTLIDAITDRDPDFPGLEELRTDEG